MENKIAVSFIVLNYNEKSLLDATLCSICSQGLKKDEFEIFFVDNHSTDGSAEHVKKCFPEAKVIVSEKNIGTAGMNLALPNCRGSYIFWEGGDTVLTPGSIRQMITTLESSKDVGGVFPKIIDEDGVWRERHSYYSRTLYFFYADEPMHRKERHAIGPGMIKKEALDKLGYLYDPLYFYSYEDHDLGLRMRLLGYRVLYDEHAVIIHRRTGSFIKKNNAFTLLRWYERNSLLTFLKIYSWRSLALYLPYNIFLRTAFFVKDAVTLRWDKAAGRAVAVFEALSHLPYLIRQRRRVQESRIVSDSELIKDLVEEKNFLKAGLRGLF